MDNESYNYFVNEAEELLQTIEQELLTLREDRHPSKVHNLMRAAHTLKGASASVGLNNINQISHGLEGIFKSLYNPDLVIDQELETLLFQGYEYLQLTFTEETTQGANSDPEILDWAASILAEIQEKLGDDFNPEAAIPSSEELGFDMVQSIFEVGVTQQLENLSQVLDAGDITAIAATLQDCITVFIGLAESLGLPGFGKIANITEQAVLEYPSDIVKISTIALENFLEAQQGILKGDRTSGGEVSPQLLAMVNVTPTSTTASLPELDLEDTFGDIPQDSNLEDTFGEEIFPALPSILEEPLSVEENLLEEDVFLDVSPSLGDLTESKATLLEDIFGDFAPPAMEEEESSSELEELSPKTEESLVSNEPLPPEPIANPTVSQPIPEPSETTSAVKILPSQTVRVEVDQLERLNFQAGELLINQNKQAAHNEQLQASMQELRSRLQQHQQTLDRLRYLGIVTGQWGLENVPVSPSPHTSSSTLLTPSHVGQLDALEFDQYSEAYILWQTATEEMVQMEETAEALDLFTRQSNQTIEKQQRLLTEIRDDLTQARMQKLEDIFQRLERLIKQLTQVYGKSINLKINGSQVLVDKVIAQKLYDPLLHLVRNAFAHGIESPEVRQKSQKPETGRIEIHAYNQGNRTIIKVSDDGQGIDFERIRQRGQEKGLLNAQEAESASESKLLELLFESGFSTASEANDLFGRGVGLDVVREQLENLQGKITIKSVWQQGTTFSLHLPLTLSIAKLLVFQADNVAYALSSDSTEQVIISPLSQITQLGNQRVLSWQQGEQEQTVPLHRFSDLVDYNSPLARRSLLETSKDALSMVNQDAILVMLLRTHTGLMGLEVDQIIGEQELVIRPLGEVVTPPSYVYGCSILGNSRLALVIDIMGLVNQRIANAPEEILNFSPSSTLSLDEPDSPELESERSCALILIVDDSITLRQNLMQTMQKAGYQTIPARDGVEATEQLQQNPQVALVICDLEMPRMNGFEFLNYCSHNPAFQKIPIIILTSRQGQKHRQIALGLGASEYITKPYLEHELLSMISHQLSVINE